VRTYHVYILASRSRRLYIGVTNNLVRRLWMHRDGQVHTTAKYCIRRLVYVETTDDIRSAIAREKQLKGWVRGGETATAVRGYTSTRYLDWHTAPRNARRSPGGDRLANSPRILRDVNVGLRTRYS